ncbi:DUF2946 domain-containing protein [Trinickia terrae]|uniref:DUF2946 domain-containing protein n=1 Tax=Trinickia terrae TaxID=2571161 RepID=A0A4U1HJY1_9BURK|nr:DUF2946 domain-containing protein [Trinickia terrae]TKC79907.1 DUF2946 domain-containing protein [Trinickia terrae]
MFRRSRKLTAWLGIFAIWLTVLAPLVSQLEARASRFDSPICGADAGSHAQHGSMSMQHAHHGAHPDACGYCNLFAHSPALGTAVPALPGIRHFAESATSLPSAAKPRLARYPSAYPRAPPIDA